MADTLIPDRISTLNPELGDIDVRVARRAGVVEDENLLTLNLGPQHPSTHGVFRMIMQLQGETVIGAMPVMGYLHRSTEKLGEARTYVQGTVLTDRMDYLSPITSNWAYALAIETPDRPGRARARRVLAGHHRRVEPHPVAPDRRRHLRHGRGHLRHAAAVRAARTRVGARPAVAADWRAHEPVATSALAASRATRRPSSSRSSKSSCASSRPRSTSTRRS